MEVRTREPYDLAAVIHVHSGYPDGGASVPDILEAAADAEAEAVLLTDEETVRARERGYEGWHQGVLLLVGLETSAQGAHLLSFGIDEFLAEPYSPAVLEERPITGIELWAVEAETVDGAEQLVDPPQANLGEWDRLCRRRRVVGIGGLDAHHRGRGLSPLRNERFFRMLRNHLLCERPPTGRLDEDRALLLDALREGRCFIGRDSLANTRNFRFYADGERGYLPMGGEAPADDWTLHVRLPLAAELRLVRDGEQIDHEPSCGGLDLRVREPGVYRVEARLRAFGSSRTWIISNPIYLRAA